MNLSISIIGKWFNNNINGIVVRSNKINIKSFRLYSPGMQMDSEILYVGSSDDFFGDGKKEIVCKNRSDFLVLKSTNLSFVINSIQDCWEYYSEWYSKCNNIIIHNQTIDELLDLSTIMLPTPIVVVDAAQTFVAISKATADFQNEESWKNSMEKGSVSEELLKKYNLAHPNVYNYSHVFAVESEYFFCKGYCKHVFINGSRRASVILKDPDDVYKTADIQIFDIFTDLIKNWIIACGEETTSFHIKSYFSRALEGDLNGVSAMIRQTVLFGWDERCTKVLFLVAPVDENYQFDVRMISGLTREAEGTYAIIHNNNVVILLNSDIANHAEFNSVLNTFLKKRHCCGVASFSFSEMRLLKQAYQLACSSLDSNQLVSGLLYHCRNISMKRVVKILNEQAANTLQHPAVAILKRYDVENKTDFSNTLFVYLKNERRHQNTSEEMFIHRNTLFQRLQKINDIIPINLDDPDERFHLLFSFYQDLYSD